MKSCLLVVFVAVAMSILAGCSMSREAFIKEAKTAADRGAVPSTIPAGISKANAEKLREFRRNIFQDESILNAIYDQAKKDNVAWSYDSITNSRWFTRFILRGLSSLSDERKIELIKMMSAKYTTSTPAQCTNLKKTADAFYPLLSLQETGLFLQIQYEALKAGANAPKPVVTEKVKEDAAVAGIALVAKAKSAYSDDELRQILKSLISAKDNSQPLDCKTISQLLILSTEIEPKYRKALFDLLSAQRGG